MANENHLFLLGDHIKLALLERSRASTPNVQQQQQQQSTALTTNTDNTAADDDQDQVQDRYLGESIEQFREGLHDLKREAVRLRASGQEESALQLVSTFPDLERQLYDYTEQFRHLQDLQRQRKLAQSQQQQRQKAKSTVPPRPLTDDVERQLFGSHAAYRDDPLSEDATSSTSPPADDNDQLLAYHEQVMRDQDTQLDALASAIHRQRDLGHRIGEELDTHIHMLDATDELAERHTGRVNRARQSLRRLMDDSGESVLCGGGDSRGCLVILVLILVLVFLIVVLK